MYFLYITFYTIYTYIVDIFLAENSSVIVVNLLPSMRGRWGGELYSMTGKDKVCAGLSGSWDERNCSSSSVGST